MVSKIKLKRLQTFLLEGACVFRFQHVITMASLDACSQSNLILLDFFKFEFPSWLDANRLYTTAALTSAVLPKRVCPIQLRNGLLH